MVEDGAFRHKIYYATIVKELHGEGSARSLHSRLVINKPAARVAGQTLPDATPPVGKIHPFSKIAVTFEPMQRFRCPLT